MTDYTVYSDTDLWSLAAKGDASAEEELIERYARTVRVCARPYFLAGGDSEDLIQEGMLGLLSAIRRFDESSGASFKTYAETCIRNRVLEAVKAASRKKHGPLNDGVSLEYIILSEESQVGPATQPEIFRRTPEEQVLARESEKEFYSTFSRCLSVFETEVLFHFLDGLSYRQIAEAVGRTEKAVDNAVQRIRRKLARQPFLGDISRS
ncbi:MAG: sigma-70 family RNA polymerase sigma factor [Lachnospiraceae bacterium]|jgi:RNA polymerase sporulation-specific sigma factor|uniref:RNA polymerase sigma factor SigS n=1 Tax=Candidatus Scatomorpha intestinigallinarum TaxID=2840923 RepID=A0A9D1IZ48_9FIRM|nr:sigma-70 family RNA polymerase sigma factor [Candidatus Scatomorpha intestinigallinarum]